MRLLLIAAVLGVFFVCFPASTSCLPATAGKRQAGSISTPEQQPDISRSGREFSEVCLSVGSEGAGSKGEGGEGGKASEAHRDAARVSRDATCLGWVAGFTEGFLVHDELLGVPRRDRVACVPRGVTTMQIVRVIKKYLADNPEKAHRATRYIVSLALAGAFPCRGGK